MHHLFHSGLLKSGLTHSSLTGRIVTVLACLFLAFCTSVGPIYRADSSISSFSWVNALIFVLAFVIYELIVIASTGIAQHRAQSSADSAPSVSVSHHPRWHRFIAVSTRNTRSLWIFFLIGWIWVPLIIHASFGADVLNQSGEVRGWFAQIAGHTPSRSGFTTFDTYPIGHYLLACTDAQLSNQHNLLLTIFNGSVLQLTKTLFHSETAGILILALLQYVFAAFCTASMIHRLLILHPHLSDAGKTWALSLLIFSPMVALATTQITKTPLFAFASAWWISLICTSVRTSHLSTSDRWQLAISTFICLLSVKYAAPIVVITLVVLLIADHVSWKQWVICLLLPFLLFHGIESGLYASGVAVQSDPIEGKAIQIQQIARVVQRDPQAIASLPAQTRSQLASIFDLKGMARVYNPQDADPVKSSGGRHKVTSYRWRTVTRAQIDKLTSVWLQVIRANPRIATDAFIAEFYGYFDIADQPSIPITYYASNKLVRGYLGPAATCDPIRKGVVAFVTNWGKIPVLGWPVHGNFWVILTLLAACVQLRLHRWRDLLWMLPLLLQMGVMVFAPANNFDRHMIPLAVCSAFVLVDVMNRETQKIPDKKVRDEKTVGKEAESC